MFGVKYAVSENRKLLVCEVVLNFSCFVLRRNNIHVNSGNLDYDYDLV